MSLELSGKSKNEILLNDIANTEKICSALLKTKHYEKMGREGIFAIIQKANALGIPPIEALNGGMYYVQGKVELSAITMARLIRQQKHSITMDKNSDGTKCILHGKRADNGDTWKASFSIDEAKRAGIYKEGSPWSKYPDVMCYNRALSKLARQLFPDVIRNCYVEGEISDAEIIDDSNTDILVESKVDEVISTELTTLIDQCDDDFKKTVLNFLETRFGAPDFSLLPAEMSASIREKIEAHIIQKNSSEVQ